MDVEKLLSDYKAFEHSMKKTFGKICVGDFANDLAVEIFAYSTFPDIRYYKPRFDNRNLFKVYNETIREGMNEWIAANKLRASFMPQAEMLATMAAGRVKWEQKSVQLQQQAHILNWGDTKQIFSFDADFLDALAKTEDVMIVDGLFSHLPFTSMYLDFSKSEQFVKEYDCEGFFVDISHGAVITEQELRAYSDTKDLTKKNHYNITINSYPFNDMSMSLIVEDGEELTEQSARQLKRTPEMVIVLQCLTYLASIEPDVSERKYSTSNTDKSGQSADRGMNKLLQQIKEHEVGYRFGAAYRAHVKTVTSEVKETKVGGQRKPRAPYIVKAHYNYYWCGKGRTELRPRWLSPFYVGVKNSNDLIAVVKKVD